tara:strand:+ start:5389 stop:5610 length:222 start_codon:yes stop_codon:yes gene_type:complete
MSKKTSEDKTLEKLYWCIIEGKITEKKDLKLFGITESNLQKEVIWKIFEEKVLTSTKKEKSNIIRYFHRTNLL